MYKQLEKLATKIIALCNLILKNWYLFLILILPLVLFSQRYYGNDNKFEEDIEYITQYITGKKIDFSPVDPDPDDKKDFDFYINDLNSYEKE